MSINIVHISQSVHGGAGRAAWRLHKAMLSQGYNSHFLSNDEENDLLQVQFHNKVSKLLPQNLLQRIHWKFQREFSHNNILQEKNQILTEYEKIYRDFKCEVSTLPFGSINIEKNELVKQADLLILHWVSNMFDWPIFFEGTKKKRIIWTLHDMNPFKGLFHYEDDEQINYDIAHELDEKVNKIKQHYLQKRKSNLKIVAPSKWLVNNAQNSLVLKGLDCYHITYSIDLSIFKLQDSEKLKKKYGFKPEDIVMLFVAQNIENRRKGFDLLLQAIDEIVNPNIKFVAIGDFTNQNSKHIKFLSKIDDDNQLADYFSIADAFILPSREDNLPNVIMEAFACGCPIIGFPVGGIQEHIITGVTGVLADKVSVTALVKAIQKYIEMKNQFNRIAIRKYAEQNFSIEKQAKLYFDIYNSFD